MTDQPLFESIRQEQDGQEYWSARDLSKTLAYTQWRAFMTALKRAMAACKNSGQDVADHFAETSATLPMPNGAQKKVEDFRLSRYACYLIVQNADPSKPLVALGQTYFALQTRRQELAEHPLATEDRLRLERRGQLTTFNKELAEQAHQAGVVDGRDFAIFQDHGYMGLYGGLKSKQIHERKGLSKSQHILDHMGSDELAANIFRSSQTKQKLEREKITGKSAANKAHLDVGKKVRQTIAELGGTMPEHLPTPTTSIQQLKRKEEKRLKEHSQPKLLGD